MDFNRIINGMIRAARLDKSFYEEVEHDTSYTQDALAVVILVSAIGAFGNFLGQLVAGNGILAAILGFIGGLLLAVVGYYLWVFIAQYIGTRFFKGTGDFGEVQRAFGFAYAPQVLNILSALPCGGWLIGIVAWLWSIAAGLPPSGSRSIRMTRTYPDGCGLGHHRDCNRGDSRCDPGRPGIGVAAIGGVQRLGRKGSGAIGGWAIRPTTTAVMFCEPGLRYLRR